MRMALWIITSWVSLAAIVAVPQRVRACTCATTAIYHSDPEDGARDVALNRAFVVAGAFDPASVRLENEDGDPVDFVLNEGPWLGGCAGNWAELIPKSELAPNSSYSIRVEPTYSEADFASAPTSVSFTTGTATLAQRALTTPVARASVVFDAPQGLCGTGGTVFLCLGIDDTREVEFIIRKGDEILTRTDSLVQDDGVYGLHEVPDCIDLQRRAATGQRSEPFRLCGKELDVRRWKPSDSDRNMVLLCSDGVVGIAPADPTKGDRPQVSAPQSSDADAGPEPEPDSLSLPAAEERAQGCAVGGGTSGAAGAQLLALLGCALLVRRRGWAFGRNV